MSGSSAPTSASTIAAGCGGDDSSDSDKPAVTIANKGVKGLWKDMPIFANDLSALSWS